MRLIIAEDDQISDLYADLCDLFDQAIFMGRGGAFDAEPDTDPERLLSTSPQARRFASAAMEVFGLDQSGS